MSEDSKIKPGVTLPKEAVGLLTEMNLHTRLLEVFDWDEDRAILVFEKLFTAYVDLYEYTQYDKSITKTEDDFISLARTNLDEVLTDEQFKAAQELLDHSYENKKIKKENKPGWVNHSYNPIRIGDLVVMCGMFTEEGVGVVLERIPANVYESECCCVYWSTGMKGLIGARYLKRLT